jgi:hypothetical protein
MTTDEQRIAIAQACGWQIVQTTKYAWVVISPLNMEVSWSSCDGVIDDRPASYYLPDYLGDLNACHEMEQVLTYEQAEIFEDELCDVAKSANDVLENPAPWRFVFHATAAQRAEAFLRTLGLWTATPPQPQ